MLQAISFLVAQVAPVPIQRSPLPPPPQVRVQPPLKVPILKMEPPPPQTNIAEMAIKPDYVKEFFQQKFKFPDNDPSWPCRTPANLTRSTQAVVRDSFMAGYRHQYDDGTDPFPCTTRLTEVGRGGVRFDLTRIFNHLAWLNNPGSKVEKARLQFRRELLDGRDCGDHMVTSADPWPTESIEWLGGRPWIDQILVPKDDSFACGGFGNICEIDVAPIVQGWVVGSRPNNGLIFIGENEDNTARGNGACRVRYTNFQMELRIVYPVRP